MADSENLEINTIPVGVKREAKNITFTVKEIKDGITAQIMRLTRPKINKRSSKAWLTFGRLELKKGDTWEPAPICFSSCCDTKYSIPVKSGSVTRLTDHQKNMY